MTWIYWTVFLFSVLSSFWLGKRYGTNSVVNSIIVARDKYWHDKFLKPWSNKYNRMLQEFANVSTEGHTESHKRNVILLMENERFRRKAIRLAFKYEYFRKKYEEKPMHSAANEMARVISYIAKAGK